MAAPVFLINLDQDLGFESSIIYASDGFTPVLFSNECVQFSFYSFMASTVENPTFSLFFTPLLFDIDK